MKKKNDNWQPVIFAGVIIVLLVYALSSFPFEMTDGTIVEDRITGGECATDKDCRAAGCSGQICTTAANARGVFTTCEWREEYGCLKYTNCGCNNGRCGWEETEDYSACIEGLNE